MSSLERDVVILTCAISAGIHAALVREHFAEGTGPGGGFLASVILLGGVVVALTRRRPTAAVLVAACVVLACLLAGYGLAITTGVPWLHPDVEPVDGLALATKAIETIGLVAALDLLRRGRGAFAGSSQQLKGTLT